MKRLVNTKVIKDEPWKIKIQNSKYYWEKPHGNPVTFYCLILFDDRFWGSNPPSVVKKKPFHGINTGNKLSGLFQSSINCFLFYLNEFS